MKNVTINLCPLFLLAIVFVTGCGKTNKPENLTSFTKADSLTERFLELHDSSLAIWNTLIRDENEKIRSMHELIHELLLSGQSDKEQLVALENRMSFLTEMKLTTLSIENRSFVEEYDFTTNSIVTELMTLGESHEQFAENNTLRKLVDNIKLSDQRMENNRANYDVIINQYNRFVSSHQSLLNEINIYEEIRIKPLFQETSIE